jgi:anti-anti-sigma regulatory factor
MPIQHWSENIWVVKLANEPALSDDLTLTRDEVQRADPAPDLAIDFAAVSRMSSSNLSELLRLRKTMIDRDGRIKLASIPDNIWVVFLTTGLDKVFEFAEDVPTALAALQIKS